MLPHFGPCRSISRLIVTGKPSQQQMVGGSVIEVRIYRDHYRLRLSGEYRLGCRSRNLVCVLGVWQSVHGDIHCSSYQAHHLSRSTTIPCVLPSPVRISMIFLCFCFGFDFVAEPICVLCRSQHFISQLFVTGRCIVSISTPVLPRHQACSCHRSCETSSISSWKSCQQVNSESVGIGVDLQLVEVCSVLLSAVQPFCMCRPITHVPRQSLLATFSPEAERNCLNEITRTVSECVRNGQRETISWSHFRTAGGLT